MGAVHKNAAHDRTSGRNRSQGLHGQINLDALRSGMNFFANAKIPVNEILHLAAQHLSRFELLVCGQLRQIKIKIERLDDSLIVVIFFTIRVDRFKRETFLFFQCRFRFGRFLISATHSQPAKHPAYDRYTKQ